MCQTFNVLLLDRSVSALPQAMGVNKPQFQSKTLKVEKSRAQQNQETAYELSGRG